MNTHNNKRRQETIKSVENAFLGLCEKQNFSKIKVSDICKKAGINRSTFYANFIDIYDLAEKIQLRLENDVSRLLEQDNVPQYSSKDFLKLFEHIKENQKLYLFYFKLDFDNKDKLNLFNICLQDFDINAEFIDYHIAFFKSGFNAIVKRWLENGCQETPEQMKDILMNEYKGRIFR